MARKKKDSGFLGKISEKAGKARNKGLELGKIAAEEASRVGEDVAKKGKKKIEKGISNAKKMASSSEQNIELLEKLADLKEKGIITQKEFDQKKKEILKKI